MTFLDTHPAVIRKNSSTELTLTKTYLRGSVFEISYM